MSPAIYSTPGDPLDRQPSQPKPHHHPRVDPRDGDGRGAAHADPADDGPGAQGRLSVLLHRPFQARRPCMRPGQARVQAGSQEQGPCPLQGQGAPRQTRAQTRHPATKPGNEGECGAQASLPATCEDGSAPVRAGDGSFSCDDESDPDCSNGSIPALSSDGSDPRLQRRTEQRLRPKRPAKTAAPPFGRATAPSPATTNLSRAAKTARRRRSQATARPPVCDVAPGARQATVAATERGGHGLPAEGQGGTSP